MKLTLVSLPLLLLWACKPQPSPTPTYSVPLTITEQAQSIQGGLTLEFEILRAPITAGTVGTYQVVTTTAVTSYTDTVAAGEYSYYAVAIAGTAQTAGQAITVTVPLASSAKVPL